MCRNIPQEPERRYPDWGHSPPGGPTRGAVLRRGRALRTHRRGTRGPSLRRAPGRAGDAWAGWALAIALTGAAALLHHDRLLPLASVGAPPRVPWWAVALAFYVTEVFVVNLQVQEESHSFSLSEIPLVAGLFFLDADALVMARLVGGGLALALHTRLRPLKLAFNLGHFWLGACLAALAFHAVAAAGDPLGAAGWAAAFVAPLVALLVSELAIDAVVVLTRGRLSPSNWARVLGLGFASAAANTVLALVTVTILWKNPSASWLVVGLAAIFFFSYRAYTQERQKHETLELLQDAARVVRETQRVEAAIVAFLEHLRRMFRAEVAQLTLLSDGEDQARCTSLGPDVARVMAPVEIDETSEPWALVASAPEGVVMERSPEALGSSGMFVRTFRRGAMVTCLRGETRVFGAVMVADKSRRVDNFTRQELELFSTMVAHAGVWLENGRLEKTLARVTELEEQLRHQAFHDSLTGLANRALFLDRVEHATAHRQSELMGIVFLDLDGFKEVNDSLGHHAGDQLLCEVAARLELCLRPGDTPARLGGDEFAILLENIDGAGVAGAIATRISEEMKPPFEVDGREVTVRASIGVATGHATEGAKQLLRDADIAMYKAKAAGQGGYEVFSPDMASHLLQGAPSAS
jgi:diguanylate cyclase (GGDEF)-like protein